MTNELRSSRLAVALVFMSCWNGGLAKAADLGSDCCADLEERIAQLEAMTVRKGNKKVSVTLYGRVNRIVNFWDDGAEANAYVLNSSYSATRWGFRGDAKIGGAWSAGYTLEMEDNGNLSKFVDQFNDNPNNGRVIVRRSAMYVDNKKLGQVTWGHWSEAKDDITKDTVVIKGLDQTMHADFYMNWSFFLRPKGSQFQNAEGLSSVRYSDIGRCYSTASSAFDCSTRRNIVRYDTPEWYGFVGSASWGEDDIWSMAARYTADWGKDWKVGAGIAYEQFSDEGFNTSGGGVPFQGFQRDMKEWAGTGSIIHNPTGLFLWTAFSNSEDNDKGAVGWLTGRKPPEMHAWDIAGGIHRSMLDLGKTTIWGGYTQDHDGLGGFTRNSGSPSRTIWDGKLDAFNPVTRSGRFIPGVDVPSEVTGAETTKWYLAADQAVDSAAMNLYVAYQHIEPEIDLVSRFDRDGRFSETGKLRKVPVSLTDFDVFWTGARIQF
jgi:predicted porin